MPYFRYNFFCIIHPHWLGVYFEEILSKYFSLTLLEYTALISVLIFFSKCLVLKETKMNIFNLYIHSAIINIL